MHRRTILLAVIIMAAAGSYLGNKLLVGPATEGPGRRAVADSRAPAGENYRRIVSLAPSITETLFALELGNRVVGVTRYCDYPPEALGREKVGGYYDPNYEAIVALKPDLVIMLPEHEEPKKYLTELGLSVLAVNQESISGILDSIRAIGKLCGAEREAWEVVAGIEGRMAEIRNRMEGLPRPRVMLCVGRNMGSGFIEDVYIAGRDGFYDEMITIAGGMNAYHGRMPKFPMVSAEGMLRLNPEVIIDMVPDLEGKGWNEEDILKEWQSVGGVDAVKNEDVYVFGQGYAVIPGPRFILILESMARAIHPEIEWE